MKHQHIDGIPPIRFDDLTPYRKAQAGVTYLGWMIAVAFGLAVWMAFFFWVLS